MKPWRPCRSNDEITESTKIQTVKLISKQQQLIHELRNITMINKTQHRIIIKSRCCLGIGIHAHSLRQYSNLISHNKGQLSTT